MKAIEYAVLENFEEGHHTRFFQFVHDEAILKNKDECQAMGMNFADEDCEHNNAIALSFRKLSTNASDKVADLAQKACNETLVLVFHNLFSCSV